MSNDELSSLKTQSSPIPENTAGLKVALKNLLPMLKTAQEELAKLPLRPIVDVLTMETIMVRFATAEELQRIVMRNFKGRVVVDTLPVRLGAEPAVVGKVSILTNDGYVTLPGSVASQRFGVGAVEMGAKQVLSAETKSIRRTLRELGLRAEYEEYDDTDKRQKEEKSKPARKTKETPVESVKDIDDIMLDDIPSMPDDEIKVEASESEKEADNTADKKVARREKSSTRTNKKRSPAKARATKSEPPKKQASSKVEITVPDKERELTIQHEHKDWLDIESIRYQNDLLEALNKVRKDLDVTVELMAKGVFGKNHKACKRLSSYTTVEMEILYQFYVIQEGK